MRYLWSGLGLFILAVVVIWLSVFTVNEREKVIVVRIGQINRTVEEPGLNFKFPFIERLYRYDDRLLALDSEEFTVTFNDNRRLIVDAFTRWRISNVVDYHLAVREGGGDMAGRTKLAGILEDELKAVLGKVSTRAILSDDRTVLMSDILQATRAPAADMGVEVKDVRIVRADLPAANLQATFDRMSAERKQEAADERARGDEAARRIVANAQRQSREIVSGAQRQSEIIKGEADAERNNIFANAYSRDPEFFDFYRSLQAYAQSLKNQNTSIVMSPDSDFFRYLNDENSASGLQ